MAVPTTQVTPSANTQPLPLADGLRFYIVRPDSSMVPLVPADQLPFQLRGVPRQLSHQQLSHGKWTWVANASSTGAQFPVQDPSTSPAPKVSPVSPRFLAPDHNVIVQPSEPIPVARVNPKPQVTPSLPTYSLDVPVPPQRLPVVEVQNSPRSLTESIAKYYTSDAQRIGYSPRHLPPSGVEPDPTKKEYCTHWIKTGDCAFMAQGCRYKHEMPSLEKLREIGFMSMPRWWKEKTALRNPTWMQRRMQAETEKEDDEGVMNPRSSKMRDFFEQVSKDSVRDMPEDDLPPPSPKSNPVDSRQVLVSRRDIPRGIPNLIDFDDTPAPPPSLQSSDSSAIDNSDLASESSITSSSVASLEITKPPMPVNQPAKASLPSRSALVPARGPSPPAVPKATPGTPVKPQRRQQPRILHRQSALSLSSADGVSKVDTKRDVASSTSSKSIQPPKPKKVGLAKSRYATAAATNEASTKFNDKLGAVGTSNSAGSVPSLDKQITKLARDTHRRDRKTAKISVPRATSSTILTPSVH